MPRILICKYLYTKKDALFKVTVHEVKNLKVYNEYLQTHYKNILQNVKQDMQIIQELMDLYINKQDDLSKND